MQLLEPRLGAHRSTDCASHCKVWAVPPEPLMVSETQPDRQIDDIGTFNLTLEGMGACLRQVLDWGRPTLLLGGGGCGHMTVT